MFFKGQSKRLHGLLLDAVLPSTMQYITYQGSLPFPACYETATWILLNQPIVITETQVRQHIFTTHRPFLITPNMKLLC